jgi:hypothetical protein
MQPLRFTKPIASLLLSLSLLLATSERLPAPISEESPTPAPEQSVKPKAKRVTEAKTNRNAKPSTATSTPTPTSSKRFAGTWSGIMPEVPWGNVAVKLVVDSTETIMDCWWEADTKHLTAKAQLSGNTLHARFPAGFTTATWSITPQLDGATAQVRLQAFMNDQTAIFRRVSR